MPVVKQSRPIKLPTKGAPKAKNKPETGFRVMLPTEPSAIVHDINKYIGTIHGLPGIGKTTLVMNRPDVLLINFDRIQRAQSIMQVHCPDWSYFEATIAALKQAKATGAMNYSRIVIDGVDIAYRHCQAHTEKALVVEDIADEQWGKGWNQLDKRFAKAIHGLMGVTAQTDTGLWFISHSQKREVDLHDGRKRELWLPQMKGGCERVIVALSDFVFAYHYIGQKRVLTIRGNEKVYAKCCIDTHFLTPDGKRVVEVPMGDNSTEAWNNLVNAFENKQSFTHIQRTAATAATLKLKHPIGGKAKPVKPAGTNGIPAFSLKRK